ncbi:hypothetical protein [Nocardia sp. NPDC046763]|uniref:hypothetical protein n=1 Tax=Nocardia sp. NPDC046763 TaxID=3155256 RepID=UPI003405C8DA
MSYASEATVRALLAVEERLGQIEKRIGQLVDATEAALVINATITGIGALAND